MGEVSMELAFHAGFAAHERGLTRPLQLATAADIAELAPKGPPVVVVTVASDLDVAMVRLLAAVHGAGRTVLVVCDRSPDENLTAWLPEACWVVSDNEPSPLDPHTDLASSSPAVRLLGSREDRLNAARDSSTPAGELRSLAQDPDASVRALVALNHSTPEQALAELAHDPQMGRVVLHNDHASDEVRATAAAEGGYESEAMDERTVYILGSPELLEQTMTRCSESVLRAIIEHIGPERGTWQNRQQTAAFIRWRVQQDSVGPLNAGPFEEGVVEDFDVVRNKLACLQLDATPPSVVEMLARDDDSCVRIAAGAVMISKPNAYPAVQGERIVERALAEPRDTGGEWEGDWEAVVQETFDFVQDRCKGADAELQAEVAACRNELLA